MKRMPPAVLFLCPGLLCFAVAIAPAFSAQRSTTQAANGRRIFNQYCAGCHDTLGATTQSGPALRGYYHRQPRPSDLAVQRIIQQGEGTMPAFRTLSSSQLNDLIAYLKTL
jgi:mono/diheme cytochrome c family protein